MSDGAQQKQGRTPAEWVSTAVALVIVLAIAGLIVYDWIATPDVPPMVSIEQSSPTYSDNQRYYVPFTVTNTGGSTAEAVQVIAELEIDGEVVEDGEQSIDFLSMDEQQDGAFVFTRDPAQGTLTLRVGSYKSP